MERAVLLGIATVALAMAVACAVRLWRLRTTAEGAWRTQDYLTALGLVVALLGIVLPLLLAENDDGESPEETAYRAHVTAACAGLRSASNPILEAARADGTFDRARLVTGFRRQLDGFQGVLDGLWATTVPNSLADAAAGAHQAGDDLIAATAEELKDLGELPGFISFMDLSAAMGALNAALQAPSSRFEGAMTTLAGQPCRAPTVPTTAT